jgi:hypothetical protein
MQHEGLMMKEEKLRLIFVESTVGPAYYAIINDSSGHQQAHASVATARPYFSVFSHTAMAGPKEPLASLLFPQLLLGDDSLLITKPPT